MGAMGYVSLCGRFEVNDLLTNMPRAEGEEIDCGVCLELIQAEEATLYHETCRRHIHQACLEEHFQLSGLANPYAKCVWCRGSYDSRRIGHAARNDDGNLSGDAELLHQVDQADLFAQLMGNAPPPTPDEDAEAALAGHRQLLEERLLEYQHTVESLNNHWLLRDYLRGPRLSPTEFNQEERYIAVRTITDFLECDERTGFVMVDAFIQLGVTPELVWSVVQTIRAYRSVPRSPLRNWTGLMIGILWGFLDLINGDHIELPVMQILQEAPILARRYGLPVEVAVMQHTLRQSNVSGEVAGIGRAAFRAFLIGFVAGNLLWGTA